MHHKKAQQNESHPICPSPQKTEHKPRTAYPHEAPLPISNWDSQSNAGPPAWLSPPRLPHHPRPLRAIGV
jgi:hypothetical protein